MSLFFYFFIFFLGLAVGSFLNCIIYRLHAGQSFLKGRSFCPFCKHQLSWPDLIPIFSFLALKGRCRHCRQKISFQYPLVELATGVLFLIVSLSVSDTDRLICLITISCFLVIIFVYDLKHYIIPDKVVYPAIGITLIYHLLRLNLEPERFSLGVFWAAFGAAAFFGTIVLISRGRWIGVGDVKLAFLMGLILGFPNILVALFLAVLLGAIMGIGLIISGKKTLRSEVPFGPFLVTGTFVALFWGQDLANWYLNLCM